VHGDILLLDQVQLGVGRGHAFVATSVGPSPSTTSRASNLVRSSHGGVQRGQVAHHALVLVLFVGVHSLRVLTQVVKTRKLLGAMARKRTFTSVFPAAR